MDLSYLLVSTDTVICTCTAVSKTNSTAMIPLQSFKSLLSNFLEKENKRALYLLTWPPIWNYFLESRKGRLLDGSRDGLGWLQKGCSSHSQKCNTVCQWWWSTLTSIDLKGRNLFRMALVGSEMGLENQTVHFPTWHVTRSGKTHNPIFIKLNHTEGSLGLNKD